MASKTWSKYEWILFRIMFLLILPSTVKSQDGAPKIHPFNFPPKVQEGESTKVLCSIAKGEKPLTFRWLMNGNLIIDKQGVSITDDTDFSLLKINNAKASDSGNFTCIAENIYGTTNYSASLAIEAPPRWNNEPIDKELHLGQSLLIDCTASGHPHPKAFLTKISGEEPEITGPTISGLQLLLNGTYNIGYIKSEHGGTYQCSAENGVGQRLTKVFTLKVLVPARFDEKFSVVTVKKGDSASLKCEAIGDQPLAITWRKEMKELNKVNGGRYEIFETLTPKGLKSELVVREADRSDGTLYSCASDNPYGKDERSLKLLVLEVPATPLDLKIQEVWSRSVSVTWSPPYTGNSPITKYIVQYWKDTVSGGRHRLQEKEVTSAQTSALIKDLQPGTSYGMAVVAENTVGRGEPSDSVTFTTGEEEPTGAPIDVNVEVKGATSLLVTWKAPPKSEWNGKLRGYYVGYRVNLDSTQPYSFKTVEFLIGVAQEYMISNLRKDTEYSVIVKAFNAAGSGPPSQEIVIRTLGGDFPPAPVVYIVAASDSSMKIQWKSLDSKTAITGHTVHYRKKSGSWQKVPILSQSDNTYTLTGLDTGALYQVYVTANSDYGEGDPSEVMSVKTHGKEDIVLVEGTKELPMYLDMSLVIPVAACLLAIAVVVIAVCVWVLKAKSRRNLERAIQKDKRYIYAASQRYVDIDKTRSLPAYTDPDMGYPTPYATVPMADDASEGRDDTQQEMKSFLPQVVNMKDRPLPIPKQSSSLKKKEGHNSHIYDSPQ